MYKPLVNYTLIYAHKSLATALTLAHMKMLVALFILGALTAKAQFVYIEADKPFLVTNAPMQTPATACWVNMNGARYLFLQSADGTELKREIPAGVEKPIYMLVENRLRYRPNIKPQAADTVTCSKNLPVTDLLVKTDTLAQTVAAIKQLEFEYERTEKVEQLLTKPGYSCEERLELLECLAYDASRAEVLRKVQDALDEACYQQLLQSLPVVYQEQLKKKS